MIDTDECSTQAPCLDNEVCMNTIGSFECYCIPGYTRNPMTNMCVEVLTTTEPPTTTTEEGKQIIKNLYSQRSLNIFK